jgi:hypothetical protein
LMARGGRAKLAYDGATDERSHEHSCFLIARQDAEGADVLVLRFPDGQTALPVFSLEEEAGMFLWLEALDEDWQVEEFSVGELAALLRGPCASVERVAPNPFAATDPAGGLLATVDREDFLRRRMEGAMEVELIDIEVTEDGTIVEVMRIVDVKDAISPVRLRVREWIDERHYRDVEVAEEFWALYAANSSRRELSGQTKCGEQSREG